MRLRENAGISSPDVNAGRGFVNPAVSSLDELDADRGALKSSNGMKSGSPSDRSKKDT